MLSTVVLIVVYLGVLIFSLALWAVFLRLGLRWAKVKSITTRRVIYVTVIVFAIQLLLSVLSALLARTPHPQIVLAAITELVVFRSLRDPSTLYAKRLVGERSVDGAGEERRGLDVAEH